MKNNGTLTPRRWRLPALILGMAASAFAWSMDVRVASQVAIAPKWIVKPESVTGICPDIMLALERIEPRLHFTAYRHSRSLPAIENGLETGSVDAACALVPTARRQAIAIPVGKAVYVTRPRLVARAGDAAVVRDVQDLVRLGALVTSQRGSAFTEKLKEAGVKVDDATDDHGVNLRKMLAGHGRFAYVNELSLQHYVHSEHLQEKVRVLPVVLGSEPSYFWVSKKADPALPRLLGAAIDKLKANGELDRIYARWASLP